jgi:hypothetical protein
MKKYYVHDAGVIRRDAGGRRSFGFVHCAAGRSSHWRFTRTHEVVNTKEAREEEEMRGNGS